MHERLILLAIATELNCQIFWRAKDEYRRPDRGGPTADEPLRQLVRRLEGEFELHLRIRPGHPHENGRHERMHRTLKQETTRPPGQNTLQQQDRFDRFVNEFNTERPHEALAMKTPAECYEPSRRSQGNRI